MKRGLNLCRLVALFISFCLKKNSRIFSSPIYSCLVWNQIGSWHSPSMSKMDHVPFFLNLPKMFHCYRRLSIFLIINYKKLFGNCAGASQNMASLHQKVPLLSKRNPHTQNQRTIHCPLHPPWLS